MLVSVMATALATLVLAADPVAAPSSPLGAKPPAVAPAAPPAGVVEDQVATSPSLPPLDPLAGTEPPSLSGSIALSFISLGIVCLLAYFALRWLSHKAPIANNGPLRVLARHSLDPKRAVFVIEAADRCFLVGAGDGSMNLLAELDRTAFVREAAARAPKGRPLAARFQEILARAINRPASTPAPAPVLEQTTQEASKPEAPAPADPSKPDPMRAEGGLA